jgi:hypothetical protein
MEVFTKDVYNELKFKKKNFFDREIRRYPIILKEFSFYNRLIKYKLEKDVKEFSFYNQLIKYKLKEDIIVDKNCYQSIIEFQKFYKLLFNNQFNTKEQLEIVGIRPCYIIYMIDCDPEIQEKAIRYNCNVIQLIHEQSDHIQNVAIDEGCLLGHIISPTLEMQRKAVKINSINILYISHIHRMNY